MASPADDIWDAIVAVVVGLGLTAGGVALQVSKRKVPDPLEGVDSTAGAYVSPDDQDQMWERFTSEGDKLVGYPYELVFVAPSNRDPETNAGDPLEWQKKAADAFGRLEPLLGLETFYRLEVVPGSPFDREAYRRANQDVARLGLWVFSIERTPEE